MDAGFSIQSVSLLGAEGVAGRCLRCPPPAVLLQGLCCARCLLLLSASLPSLGNGISMP